jgi:hypothetical protein
MREDDDLLCESNHFSQSYLKKSQSERKGTEMLPPPHTDCSWKWNKILAFLWELRNRIIRIPLGRRELRLDVGKLEI